MRLADVIRTARGVKVEHARKFAQHVVPEVMRPARVIWNQAIGGIFFLFAVSFAWYSFAQHRNTAAFAGGLFLTAVMTFFCITSFLKARRIARRF
ncbi:MAG: hypothetical protein JO340_13130 [Acidobacteriaceae bacterium]|nr:hypothetical protein [Acidobacteriaceae bacterium]